MENTLITKIPNTAVIKSIAIQNIENREYFPIQISVLIYENGKQTSAYDSIVNPMRDISKFTGIPKYINKSTLYLAPSIYTVINEIRELVKDCEIEADEMFQEMCAKML